MEVEAAAGVGLEDADAPAVDIVGAELFVDERGDLGGVEDALRAAEPHGRSRRSSSCPRRCSRSIWIRYQR